MTPVGPIEKLPVLPTSDTPMTVAIEQVVLPGKEQEFEEFLQAIVQDAWQFPGFTNVRVTRPVRGDRLYRIVLNYDSHEHLTSWLNSDIRKTYEARRELLVEKPPRVSDITNTAQERALAQAFIPIGDFVQASVSSIGLLLAATFAALLMVNLGFQEEYEKFWKSYLTIGTENYNITANLRHWINDGLMALFFFLLGLEIKREFLAGNLRSVRQASLPIIAAVGGALVPAVIYVAINWGSPGMDGWGIPLATDTAFTIGILTLFGSRIPPMLLVFLTAFAIVDDILAVGVIAIFYTSTVHWNYLGLALVLLALLIFCNRAGFQNWPVYAGLGVLVWLAVFESGVHGTLAGILVAATVPAQAWISPTEFISRSQSLLSEFKAAWDPNQTLLSNHHQQEIAERWESLIEDVETPLAHMEHNLSPWIAYGIVPIFAFANAGIPIVDGFGAAITSAVGWGVILGLAVGKPIGIILFAWLAVRLGFAALPDGINWHEILGVGALGGIGFTMSLFISELAFDPGEMQTDARIGILIGSIIAGIFGYLVLRWGLRWTEEHEAHPDALDAEPEGAVS